MGTIMVTGATGQLGGHTLKALLENGAAPNDIVALVRNPEKGAHLSEKGITLKQGSYDEYGALVKAFAGVEKLMFISGTELPDRTAQHLNVVKAAREAGVAHVVYTSFERRNETPTSPIAMVAGSHLATEKALQESGMAYTLLRNNIYMDFIPMFAGDQVLQTGTIYLPAGQGKGAFVLREEMAEAAAKILLGSGHANKVYRISNITNYSYADVAREIGRLTGREIQYVSPTVAEYTETLTKAGVPAEYIGLFAAFAQAHAEGEFEVADTDLEFLLGRKPLDLADFLAGIYGVA